MEPTTLYIKDPYKTEINNNTDNIIIGPQATSIIESTNIESNTSNLNQATNAIINNIESTLPKPFDEPTSKITTESSNI